MAAENSEHDIVSSLSEEQRELFSASQSQGFEQARNYWQESWQFLIEQCTECFTRY